MVSVLVHIRFFELIIGKFIELAGIEPIDVELHLQNPTYSRLSAAKAVLCISAGTERRKEVHPRRFPDRALL